MHDEFRIRAEVGHDGLEKALDALRAHDDEHGGRYAVSHDGDVLFVYSDSAAAAAQARDAVEGALGDGRDLTVERWHPLEERWEDAAAPLPSTPEQLTAEHERLIEQEDEESRVAGFPEWEVRITLPGRHEAAAFEDRLRGEGIPVIRRWRHLLVGAEDEDQARALADRLRAEAPAGSELAVEGSAGEPLRAYFRSQAGFSVFGGLGV